MKVNTPSPPPPPPPPPERVKRDTEVDKQAANRVSVSKKAWTKPTIRSCDDMTLFEGGASPDNKEDSFYYPISI